MPVDCWTMTENGSPIFWKRRGFLLDGLCGRYLELHYFMDGLRMQRSCGNFFSPSFWDDLAHTVPFKDNELSSIDDGPEVPSW